MQRHLQPAVDRFKAMEDEDKRSEFREKLNGYVNVYAFLSQIIPYADPALEMLYSYGRFLLPHLPLDRDTETVEARRRSGAAILPPGADFLRRRSRSTKAKPEGVKSPTDVGTGKAKDEKAPLVRNHQGAERALRHALHRRGPALLRADQGEGRQERAGHQDCRAPTRFDKFQLGIRKLIEELMIQRMARERQDRHPLHG